MKKERNSGVKKNDAQLALDELLNDSDDKLSNYSFESIELNKANPTEFESFPTSLIRDFEAFINYIENHNVQLTKSKGYITRKHLPEINKRISVKNEEATSYTDQQYYPYIHFFYHLALSGRLMEKVPEKSFLRKTERVEIYKTLNTVEKYFFLLETFWVDLDWGHIRNEDGNSLSLSLQDFFSVISQRKKGEKINLQDRFMGSRMNLGFLFLYFEWFGFWETELDQELMERYGRKNDFFVKSITLTNFGLKMIPLLLVERNLFIWNIAERKVNGEVNPIPGSPKEDIYYGMEMSEQLMDAIDERMEEDQREKPFFEPFTSLFPNDSIKHSLPREKPEFMNGTYTLKVLYTNRVWRKIIVAGQHSMEDLHHAIIYAFNFDDDHLYSFFLDGKKWSNDCIVAPLDDFGHPQADQVQIGHVGLVAGESFLYLYDYGDEWTFQIVVEYYEEAESLQVKPYVQESKGKSPDQY